MRFEPLQTEKQKNLLTLAAIDIGSNAARMLIKRLEKTDNGIRHKKLLFLRIPLRLGMDAFTQGRIGKERLKMLTRTMKVFSQLMSLYDVDHYHACATSALRDAQNSSSIIRQIKKVTKLYIHIISGEEEAMILHHSFQADGNLLLVDVGGGSTELSLVCDGALQQSRSVNIGTIRLLKKTVTTHDWKELFAQVQSLASGADNLRIVGSGGNINKLARLACQDGEKHHLRVERLKSLYTKLAPMTMEQRMAQYDLGESRADVIVPAAQILLGVAHHTGASSIIVPNIGLADGIISRMAQAIWDQAPLPPTRHSKPSSPPGPQHRLPQTAKSQ